MPIDRELLGIALTDHSGFDQYLDRETGDVIADFDVDIDFNHPRYILIDPLPSWMAYNLMVEFKDSVEDARLKELLEVALSGKGAFRRFKDVLLDYPDARARWFAFEAEWLDQRVSEWLEDNPEATTGEAASSASS